jgi:phosphatidylglycerophosphatase A
VKDFLTKLVATGLYSGLSPWVPGTVGSIPAWLLAYFVIAGDQVILAAATVVLSLVSVWSAGAAEKLYGPDSKKIVIDEWAGMFIAVVLVPPTLTAYLIAFLAFRAFDVAKIWPAAQAERLPAGWGVTMDDIVAGVQANLLTHVILLLIN